MLQKTMDSFVLHLPKNDEHVGKNAKEKKTRAARKGAAGRRAVLDGQRTRTSGGLKKENFAKNKTGRWVSEKHRSSSMRSSWMRALSVARLVKKSKGFQLVRKDTELYKIAKVMHSMLKGDKLRRVVVS